MFKIEIDNDRLIVNYQLNTILNNTTNDCFVDCLTKSISDITPQLFIENTSLKKNFQVIPFEKRKYIIHNNKNQALVDDYVYNFLNTFSFEKLSEHRELSNALYSLEFIISA